MLAYFIAYNVSGGHFNPATSVAVFLTERKPDKHKIYLACVIFSQICGMYAGELVVYLLVKYLNMYSLLP
jgi:glycerol uptake facilitator-like aquaporin